MKLTEKINHLATTSFRAVADMSRTLCYPASILEAKKHTQQTLITPIDLIATMTLPGIGINGALHGYDTLRSVAAAAERFHLPIRTVHLTPGMLALQRQQTIPPEFEGKVKMVGTCDKDEVVEVKRPCIQFFANPTNRGTYNCSHVEFVDDSPRSKNRLSRLRNDSISPLYIEIGD